MDFVNLHCHSEYSRLDGMSRVSEIVEYAKNNSGYACITDHRTLSGCGFLHKETKKSGIIPVYGVEFNLVVFPEEKTRGNHCCVLAKSREGFQNLCRLMKVSTENEYYVPRLPFKELKNHKEGLIVSTGCIGGLVQEYILKNELTKAKNIFDLLVDEFKDNFYVEYHNHGLEQEEYCNRFLIPWANAKGIPVVGCVDSHYTYENDKEIHRVLLAMNYKKPLEEVEGFKGFGYHLLNEKELKAVFTKEQINNTVEIAKMITDDFFVESLSLAPKYFD